MRRPDVLVAVSPSFPALLPAVLSTRLRNIPWILWLHDILPDGAQSTGLVDPGTVAVITQTRAGGVAHGRPDRCALTRIYE